MNLWLVQAWTIVHREGKQCKSKVDKIIHLYHDFVKFYKNMAKPLVAFNLGTMVTLVAMVLPPKARSALENTIMSKALLARFSRYE